MICEVVEGGKPSNRSEGKHGIKYVGLLNPSNALSNAPIPRSFSIRRALRMSVHALSIAARSYLLVPRHDKPSPHFNNGTNSVDRTPLRAPFHHRLVPNAEPHLSSSRPHRLDIRRRAILPGTGSRYRGGGTPWAVGCLSAFHSTRAFCSITESPFSDHWRCVRGDFMDD